MTRLNKIIRTTAFKLSVIYLIVFTIFAGFLILYLSYHTIATLEEQSIQRIETEHEILIRHYQRGGLWRLVRTIGNRSRFPDALLYLLLDEGDNIIIGNVKNLPLQQLGDANGKARPLFYVPNENNENENNAAPLWQNSQEKQDKDKSLLHHEKRRAALISVFPVGDKFRIVIGQDISERQRYGKNVRKAIHIGIAVLLLLGGITWIFVSRRVLKRIDSITDTSQKIMHGDLSQRLEITGSGDEFDRLAENLNAMLARIEVLLDGIKHVSNNIAHDLKTPLNRMRNHIEEMLNKADTNTRSISEILDEADGLIRIFDALLLIARVEAGNNRQNEENHTIADIISDMTELYEPIAEDVGMKLKTGALCSLTIRINRELISQALANLLDNALKYGRVENSQHRGEITVSTQIINDEDAHKKLLICVADNGSGIPQQHWEHVRKRFTRLDPSRAHPGSGLGLSLCEAVARYHGGCLRFSDNHPGLKACLELPIEEED